MDERTINEYHNKHIELKNIKLITPISQLRFKSISLDHEYLASQTSHMLKLFTSQIL